MKWMHEKLFGRLKLKRKQLIQSHVPKNALITDSYFQKTRVMLYENGSMSFVGFWEFHVLKAKQQA